MYRVLKFRIRVGNVDGGQKSICATLASYWANLQQEIRILLYPFASATFVVFCTDDATIPLLQNVPASIAGVDNVHRKELNPQEMSNFFTGIEALSNTFCTYREPIVPIDTSDAASHNDQADNPAQTDANLADKPAHRGTSGHADSEEKSGKDENESDPNGNPECADKSGLTDTSHHADKSTSSDESSKTDGSEGKCGFDG